MLVYTNIFTLKNRKPSGNRYITIFYIWFTYLKKYGGLGPDDMVGVSVDTQTLDYINSSGFFANISEGCPFRTEFSTYEPPISMMEGLSERYKCPFILNNHTINLYLDIYCLVIRPFYTIFHESRNTIFVAAEGSMIDNKYGGFFLEGYVEAQTLPGFLSGWFAFTQGDQVIKFLKDVSKGVLNNVDSPFDQPFYNYELFLRLTTSSVKKEGLNICIVDSKIISQSRELPDAFFVNFSEGSIYSGEEDLYLNKILSFMCMNF
jgi:hypothetical protein